MLSSPVVLLLAALSICINADPILNPRQASSATVASSTTTSASASSTGGSSAPFGGGTAGTTQAPTRTANSVSVQTPPSSSAPNTDMNPGGAGGQNGGGGEQGTQGIASPSSSGVAVPAVGGVGWELGLGAVVGLVGVL